VPGTFLAGRGIEADSPVFAAQPQKCAQNIQNIRMIKTTPRGVIAKGGAFGQE
jgi:hypothetical protein